MVNGVVIRRYLICVQIIDGIDWLLGRKAEIQQCDKTSVGIQMCK